MPEPPDAFMTVAEVAEILKLNQQTVRNWIDAGKLPAGRVGPRRVRIKRSDFDRLVEQGYSGGYPTTAGSPPVEGIWGGEIPPPELPES